MSENEINRHYQDYRQEQKDRRAARLPGRQADIEALATRGFKVDKKTDYQYRINDVIDLYPIHHRWHFLKTNKRGGYPSLDWIIGNFKLQPNTKP